MRWAAFWQRPVKARRNQPPFDASAMDGYAVLACRCRIRSGLPEGHWHLRRRASASRARSGRAKRFASSPERRCPRAPMPWSSRKTPRSRQALCLRARRPSKPEQNIRGAGLDFRKGEALVPAGTRLERARHRPGRGGQCRHGGGAAQARGRPLRHGRRTGAAGWSTRARPDHLLQQPCAGRHGASTSARR